MLKHVYVYFFILLFSVPLTMLGDRRNNYFDYINRYSRMAIDQMIRYKVPASITLSQGLLESAAGRSPLARDGNNHFGIKCGSSWTGPYMLMTDDALNEHFRVYSSVEESFEDHSLFLCQNKRYAALFKLDITDYKGWSRGLRAAGYATNPNYANSLIQLIEDYDLTKWDRMVTRNGRRIKELEKIANYKHQVYMCNENFYTIAQDGDTYKSIGKEMKVSERKLRKYNERDKDYRLQTGDVVFFEKKQKQADKHFTGVWYQIKAGESIYNISQRYGMRLKTLYKINFLKPDYSPKEGDLLLIR